MANQNLDSETVSSFGDEWSRYNQSSLNSDELQRRFTEYFGLFPFSSLTASNSSGFDLGCGTGRWAQFVAPKVGQLICIDPSFDALQVAKANLSKFSNILYLNESIGSLTIPPHSQDFGYSLGVLHHVPDTQQALISCSHILKPGAPLLLYLYYSFENKPIWFRKIWSISNYMRKLISRLKPGPKNAICFSLALLIYLPLSRASRLLEMVGLDVANIPLSYYRNCSIYTLFTDARDRFGTPLEHRFTKNQIKSMLYKAGFSRITFSDSEPFWVVLAHKV